MTTPHSPDTPADGDKTPGSQPKGQSTQKPVGLLQPETPTPAPLFPQPGDTFNNNGNNPNNGALGETAFSPSGRFMPGLVERLQPLLLMPGSATPDPLRPAPTEKKIPISGIGPTSQADCKRRLSSGDFCNPYSPAGCGGEYCGMKKSALANGEIM